MSVLSCTECSAVACGPNALFDHIKSHHPSAIVPDGLRHRMRYDAKPSETTTQRAVRMRLEDEALERVTERKLRREFEQRERETQPRRVVVNLPDGNRVHPSNLRPPPRPTSAGAWHYGEVPRRRPALKRGDRALGFVIVDAREPIPVVEESYGRNKP